MTQPGEGAPQPIIDHVPWDTSTQERAVGQQPPITEMPEHLRPDTEVTPVETSEPVITEAPADVAAKHTGNLQVAPSLIDTMPENVRPLEAAVDQAPASELIGMPDHLKPADASGEQPTVVHFGQPVPVERRPEPASVPFDPRTGYYGGYAGNTPVQDARRTADAQTQQGMIAALGEQQNPQQQ